MSSHSNIFITIKTERNVTYSHCTFVSSVTRLECCLWCSKYEECFRVTSNDRRMSCQLLSMNGESQKDQMLIQ